MNMSKKFLALGFGLFGCAAQAEYIFLDWNKLIYYPGVTYEIEASELVLREGISAICQLSPYTFALRQQDAAYEQILKSKELLPVSEGDYLFAYFDEGGELLGSEAIPAHAGKIRAARTFEPDYICASLPEARISVTRTDGIISFGLNASS